MTLFRSDLVVPGCCLHTFIAYGRYRGTSVSRIRGYRDTDHPGVRHRVADAHAHAVFAFHQAPRPRIPWALVPGVRARVRPAARRIHARAAAGAAPSLHHARKSVV